MTPKTIVSDNHFWNLNDNDSYNYKMNLVDLGDQPRNLYQVDHCIRR